MWIWISKMLYELKTGGVNLLMLSDDENWNRQQLEDLQKTLDIETKGLGTKIIVVSNKLIYKQ